MKTHEAVKLYKELYAKAMDGTSVPTYPDPVGTHTLFAELKKHQIAFPQNWIDYRNWLVEVGVEREARKLLRKRNKERQP